MATSLREGWIKWTLGILGAIIVGALGSGLWESLLGPAIHAVSRWVLDIASLGLASYRNGVYRQIAADNQSAVGLETLLVINLIAAFAIGWLVTTAVKESMSVGSRIQHLLSALAAASPEPRPDASAERIRQEAEGMLELHGKLRLGVYLNSACIIAVLISFIVSHARLSYVSSAEAHYHQVLRVASPYLDANERADVESKFAQIASRDDYVKLLSTLEGQCETHGQRVPQFSPW
jgi:hypothetical protein